MPMPIDLPVSLTLAYPPALYLLAVLPLIALAARPLLGVTPGARLALAVRLVILTSLILALARPAVSLPSRSLAVVFAVDHSDSLSAAEQARAAGWVGAALDGLADGDVAGVVALGRGASVLRPLTGRSATGAPERQPAAAAPDVAADATDLSAGLRLAASLFLPDGGKRVVLLSDGQENLGAAWEEASRLAERGIRLDVVPVGAVTDPEVLVEAVDSPPLQREGESVDLAVTVQSSRETEATLRLWVDGDAVLGQRVQLRAGPNRFGIALAPLPKGFHAFRARVEAAPDSYPQNNEGYSFAVVKDPARVLLVAGDPLKAAPLQAALASAGIQVELQPPQAVPASFSPLRRYDGLVLLDVAARELSLDQVRTIQGFVESLGRGLLVVGGDQSYGAGGYDGSPLGDLLPVRVKAPARTEAGQVAVVLVIDKSGSMGERTEDGATKIAAAREAALLAADALGRRDTLGVLAFDTDTAWIVSPRPVGDTGAREETRRSIRSLEASGGTEIYPALLEAYDAVRQVPAEYRHIVLLTDGVSFSGGDYDTLTANLRAERIVLSTIAVGQDADRSLLTGLAQQGDGRYHYTNRASDIPKITLRETELASGAPKLEGAIAPEVKAPSPILRGLPGALPPLGGMAVARPREGATTALASPRGDVLLAHWQRGLGRVVAWTSDAGGRWSADWLASPDLAKLWPQAVRWSLAAPLTSGLYVRSAQDAAGVRVVVEAVDDAGTLLNLLDLRARIGAAAVELPLAQVAPGRYEARLPLSEPGVYPVQVVELSGGQPTDRQEEGGLVVGYPPEYRHFGPDLGALARLAGQAGGGLLTDPRAAVDHAGVRFTGEERHQLWPWLLALALLLFPLDVGIRRLRVDHTLLRPAAAVLQRVWRGLARRPRLPISWLWGWLGHGLRAPGRRA